MNHNATGAESRQFWLAPVFLGPHIERQQHETLRLVLQGSCITTIPGAAATAPKNVGLFCLLGLKRCDSQEAVSRSESPIARSKCRIGEKRPAETGALLPLFDHIKGQFQPIRSA
jgi:hypothetical protein